MQILDETVKSAVTERLQRLEDKLQGDVVFYYGSIDVSMVRVFRDFIERTATAKRSIADRLIFFLNTPGGSAEAAECRIRTWQSSPGTSRRET